MTDPNVTYKLAFADLTRQLGRAPNANECLPLHESYKRAFSDIASAAGPEDVRPSREPAPQARTGGEDARTREAWLGRCHSPLHPEEPLSGPDKPAEPEEAVMAPEPVREYPRAAEPVLVVASAPCRACGREFERVARRGRPPVKCEECR